MQPHHSGGQPMNTSQLELQQRIRQQMQAQMQMQAQIRQQQHQAAGSQPLPQLLGSSGAIAIAGTMSHQGPHQMQQARKRNSLGMNHAAALTLMQPQQQQGSGVSQMAGMGGGCSSQTARYMDALQISSATGAGTRSEMGGMLGTTSMGIGSAASLQHQSSMGMGSSASLQQQNASMGFGSSQNMQQLRGKMSQPDTNAVSQQLQNHGLHMQQLRGQMNQSDANAITQQLQSMGSPSSLLPMSDTQPQMAAGATSAQLLMHQQKIIADLKRHLQGQHGARNAVMSTSNEGKSTSNGGSMLPPSLFRRSSSSSLSGQQLTGQQRQALFQLQHQELRRNSMSNVFGDRQDQPHTGMAMSPSPQLGVLSLSPSPQGTFNCSSSPASVGSVEPASMLAGQNQPSRCSSSSSQTNATSQLFGAATARTASEASLLMQQLASSENEQLVTQQQLLNNPGMQSMWQVGPPLSYTKVPGPPMESHVQPAMAHVGYQSNALGAASKSKPGPESASGRNGNVHHGQKSESKLGGACLQMPEDDTSAGGQQSYLDGTFEGGWQSNADLPMRRGVIFSIVKLIEQMRPDTEQMSPK
jgi:hypothetical protein